jgi:hypothetical protein
MLKKAVEVLTVGLKASNDNDRNRAGNAAAPPKEPGTQPELGPLNVPRPRQ